MGEKQPESFGQLVRARRRTMEMTQNRLAELVTERIGYEYRQGQVSAIERGVHRYLDREAFTAISGVLSLAPDDYLSFIEEQNEQYVKMAASPKRIW